METNKELINTKVIFDSKDWLEKYNNIVSRIKQGDYEARKTLSDEQIKIFDQTISVTRDGYYISQNGFKIEIKNCDKLINNSRFYYKEFNVTDIPTIDGTTEIKVKNQDSFDCAKQLLEQGFNPIVLNMANRNNPGGGVTRGSSAQEETLFRRSNLFLSLYQFAEYANSYGLQKSKYQYPMNRNFGGIYSPNVTVFRAGPFGGYAFLDKPYEIAVVSVAAMNRPETINNRLTEEMIAGTKNKIRTILRIGLKHNHDSIVLGAFGCGAFRNPPEHMAEIFDEVINEPEFKNKYKKICFAILEDHNSNKSHNREGNFKPFFDRFEKKQ